MTQSIGVSEICAAQYRPIDTDEIKAIAARCRQDYPSLSIIICGAGRCRAEIADTAGSAKAPAYC
jgi:NAD(P)-dependent dehydrogenase (short-subunit alcohol dehydrogenase family)